CWSAAGSSPATRARSRARSSCRSPSTSCREELRPLAPGEAQALKAPDDEGAGPARFLDELKLGPPAPEGLDARLELDAGQRCADTNVDAAAEADVLRGILAPNVELVWRVEHARIAVRRPAEQRDLRASRDRD